MAESEGVPKHLLRPKGNELNVKLSIDTQYIYTDSTNIAESNFVIILTQSDIALRSYS